MKRIIANRAGAVVSEIRNDFHNVGIPVHQDPDESQVFAQQVRFDFAQPKLKSSVQRCPAYEHSRVDEAVPTHSIRFRAARHRSVSRP
jgi:hypothetical protein